MNVRHFRPQQQRIIMALHTLPELIFSDIMMIVGLESLDSLHRCRQVCKIWNELILRVIWKNKSRKRIMREGMERNWGPGMLPTDEEISRAKWLGDGGLFLNFTNLFSAYRS